MSLYKVNIVRCETDWSNREYGIITGARGLAADVGHVFADMGSKSYQKALQTRESI